MEGSSDDDSLLYDNSGVLRAADATMIIYPFAIVSGAGHAVIDDGTLTVLGGLDQSVYFEGKTGVLALAQATTFDSLIFGFSNMGGDSLDLGDIKFGSSTSANFSGTAKRGVLTVTDGTDTARITLIGDYLASTFTVASDGDGGTTVTATPSSPSGGSPAHALVAATASFAPPEMGSERQARMDGFSPRLLALPHTAIA